MTQSRKDYEGEDNSLKPKVSDFEQALNTDLYASQDITEFQISPTRLIRSLLAVIPGLVILSTLGQVAYHIYHRSQVFGLIRLFYVDAEGNIPTAYSSFIWMLCSFAAAMIAISKKQAGDRFAKYWRGLALIFAYLALDEVAAVHELLIEPMRSLFHASGLFHFAWIIPGGIFFLFVVLICFKLVKTLPTKTRILLMLSGAIFVTGAIGMEMIGGWYAEAFGVQADLTYALISTAEETLEMLGVLMLLYALLSYMGSHIQPFKIQVLSK
jgi:hypothetical protein